MPDKFTFAVLPVIKFLLFSAIAVVPAFVIAVLASIVPVKFVPPVVTSVAIFFVASKEIVFAEEKLTGEPAVIPVEPGSEAITNQLFSFSVVDCAEPAVPTKVLSPVSVNVACPEEKLTSRNMFQDVYVTSDKLLTYV